MQDRDREDRKRGNGNDWNCGNENDKKYGNRNDGKCGNGNEKKCENENDKKLGNSNERKCGKGSDRECENSNDKKCGNGNDKKIRVLNLGIETFYQALQDQGVKTAQIRWHPPVSQDEEILDLLDEFL